MSWVQLSGTSDALVLDVSAHYSGECDKLNADEGITRPRRRLRPRPRAKGFKHLPPRQTYLFFGRRVSLASIFVLHVSSHLVGFSLTQPAHPRYRTA